jgi:predicted small integral membrane protein
MDLEWMAWTTPTAVFFGCIAAVLVAMTAWQIVRPSTPRRGLLPLTSTPGDRLFIGLLAGAYIHLAWVGMTEAPLWGALAITVVLMAVLLRWG